MPVNIDPEDIIGTKEAAEILDVSDREIRNKINRGTLPAIKTGKTWVLHRKSIAFYILARKMKAEKSGLRKRNDKRKRGKKTYSQTI